MKLDQRLKRWPLCAPFVTSQESISHIETVQVTVQEGTCVGRGEALGVDYLGETPASMIDQLLTLGAELQSNLNGEALCSLLPAGGARNALDCALWDLRAKLSGKRVWELLNLKVGAVTTACTVALDDPETMAREASERAHYPVLKLKLGAVAIGESIDAIRIARPDATLLIDANGAWTSDQLMDIGDSLARNRVALLEQPLPRGGDACLGGLNYPIPLCADESCQTLVELEQVADHYSTVNIKLDKCGGLTEALAMQRWCQQHGLGTMVGNMLGSSLAMAPGFLVAQGCEYVDLDGPLWQDEDEHPSIEYRGAIMSSPEPELWG